MKKNCGGGVPRHGERACGLTGGSGWVAVVSLDRGGQGGSNGTNNVVAVAVLAVLWRFERRLEKKKFKK
jgi:hypothetical protein